MDTATIIQIVEAIVAVAMALGLGVVGKLYVDSKKAYEAWQALYSSIKMFADEIKAANADKDVTQEEFDKLMNRFSEIMEKAEKLRADVQTVVDDIYELKKEIMDIIIARAVNANGNNNK